MFFYQNIISKTSNFEIQRGKALPFFPFRAHGKGLFRETTAAGKKA